MSRRRRSSTQVQGKNIVLENGIVDSYVLWKWYKKTAEGNVERQSGSIVLCNLQGEEIKRWNFFRAFPCRWIGPSLTANDRRTFAVERIQIAHEWLEVDGDDEEENNSSNNEEIELAVEQNRFPKDDIIRKNVEKDGDFYDFAAHGTPEYVQINGKRVYAKELAGIIKKDPPRPK
nr:phage tail protein [Treponema sp.]